MNLAVGRVFPAQLRKPRFFGGKPGFGWMTRKKMFARDALREVIVVIVRQFPRRKPPQKGAQLQSPVRMFFLLNGESDFEDTFARACERGKPLTQTAWPCEQIYNRNWHRQAMLRDTTASVRT